MKPNSVKRSSSTGTHDDVHATSIGRPAPTHDHTGISAMVGVLAWPSDRFKAKPLTGKEDAGDRLPFTRLNWIEKNVVNAYGRKQPLGILQSLNRGVSMVWDYGVYNEVACQQKRGNDKNLILQI